MLRSQSVLLFHKFLWYCCYFFVIGNVTMKKKSVLGFSQPLWNGTERNGKEILLCYPTSEQRKASFPPAKLHRLGWIQLRWEKYTWKSFILLITQFSKNEQERTKFFLFFFCNKKKERRNFKSSKNHHHQREKHQNRAENQWKSIRLVCKSSNNWDSLRWKTFKNIFI